MTLAAATFPVPLQRRRAALPLVLGVALMHLWLIGGGLDPAAVFGTRDPVPQRPPVIARQIVVEAPAPPPPPPPPAPVSARAVNSAAAPLKAALEAPPLPAPPDAGQPVPAAEAAAEPLPSVPAAEPAPPPPAEGLPPPFAAAEAPPPVFATRIAPAFKHEYELRRGALSGTAELHWRPQGQSYELELRGSVMGIDAIDFASRGGFDRAGLAPERFVDRRRGRERRAANFDRAGGRITFSGPQISHPLIEGAQDRVSWMLQLAAIVDADPARFAKPGAQVPIMVAGTRGDNDAWQFTVRAGESVTLADGRAAQALLLTREPRRPYDTQVEVWLDPARHHLPVRAVLTTVPAGDRLEMLLKP